MATDAYRDNVLLPSAVLIVVMAFAGLLVTAGFLPAKPAVAVIVLCAGLIVFAVARTRPLAMFSIMVFTFVTIYKRSSISMGGGAAGGGLTLALGDLLWLGTASGILLSRGGNGPRWRHGMAPTTWLLLPYLLFAAGLPVYGVVVDGWPPVYAVSGIRHLQWASVAVMTMMLCRRFGVAVMARRLVTVIAVSLLVHGAYSLIQIGHTAGVLGKAWVWPDHLLVVLNGEEPVIRARATGLLTNPNALGVMCASLLALAVMFRSAGRERRRPPFWYALVPAAAVTGLLLAGSRSALLGVLVSLPVLVFAYTRDPERRSGTGMLLAGGTALVVVLLMGNVLTPVIAQRYGRLLDVFRTGSHADPSAAIRVEEWGKLWSIYVHHFPFGTHVPPSYSLRSPVDSYYLVTALQGTPLFTLLWLLFMSAAIAKGLYHFQRGGGAAAAGLGLAVLCTTMLGAAVGMSPMPETQLVIPLWCWIGVLVAEEQLADRHSTRGEVARA